MKKLSIFCVFVFYVSICEAQKTIDTLLILKSRAWNYTSNELLKPKTYESIGWSQIFRPNTGYKIINVFRSKSVGGAWIKKAFTFDFDKDMQLISVNTDSMEKQIRDSQVQIKQIQEQKKRINETRDRQIDAIKKNQY